MVAARAEEPLRFETDDWHFTAPAALGTQADLELNARQAQRCTDEVEKLIGYRPASPQRFTWTWTIGGGPVSWATPTGVTSLVPSGESRLVDPSRGASAKRIVASGVCFGPHEVTHVLTSESWGQAWANEGFATFTDLLFDGTWRCCGPPRMTRQSCDETGYTDGSVHRPYSDLSPFRVDFASYSTAACFWLEVYRRGGAPAIRGVLAGMRQHRPKTTGEFVLHHASRVLHVDLRPLAARYGFEPAELQAGPAPRFTGCTLIGSAANDAIAGTAGSDVICGLGGRDVLAGGAGNDVLNARDGRGDVVRGGPGRDTARVPLLAHLRDEVGAQRSASCEPGS